MILNRTSFLSVIILGCGIASQAFASGISSGTVSYQFTGYSADSSCTSAPAGEQREDFTGTVNSADNSISNDPLTFSICNDPASYDGGVFSLTDSNFGTITGTLTGVDMGDTITAGVDYETVVGTFSVLTGADAGYTDSYYATTAENLTTGAGTGEFLVGTPEPGTTALAGLGLAGVIAFAVKRRKAAPVA